MNNVVFIWSQGEDDSTFHRTPNSELTDATMPEWLKELLKAYPDADDISISVPTRPGHSRNDILKRKTEQGVSGAK